MRHRNEAVREHSVRIQPHQTHEGTTGSGSEVTPEPAGCSDLHRATPFSSAG